MSSQIATYRNPSLGTGVDHWCADGLVLTMLRPPNIMVPAHRHTSAQFALPVTGAFRQTMGTADERLGPGTAAGIAPGALHATRWLDPQVGEILMINVEPEWCEEHCDLAPMQVRQLESRALIDALLHVLAERAASLIAEDHRDDLYIGSVGLTLVVGLLRHLGVRPRRDLSIGGPGPLRRVVRWIDDHLDCRLTLTHLALRADCSPHHLIRLFGRYLGTTPLKYVTERRLQRAREMLTRPESCISAVALECGFAGQSHFTRAFRRRYGLPPGEYRARSPSVQLRTGIVDHHAIHS